MTLICSPHVFFLCISYCAFLLHRQACEAALKEKQNRDASETEGFVDETAETTSDQLKALNLVFKKAAEDDTPSEVTINIYLCSYDCCLLDFL